MFPPLASRTESIFAFSVSSSVRAVEAATGEAGGSRISCFVGNDLAIAEGTYTDENGVDCVKLSGSRWSHATAFGGVIKYKDTWYFPWGNSHGPIYKRRKIGVPMIDTVPEWCGLMPEQTVRRFMGGSFNDMCAVLCTEAPYDPDLRATLNPAAEMEA